MTEDTFCPSNDEIIISVSGGVAGISVAGGLSGCVCTCAEIVAGKNAAQHSHVSEQNRAATHIRGEWISSRMAILQAVRRKPHFTHLGCDPI
jgi:hypothetical protein